MVQSFIACPSSPGSVPSAPTQAPLDCSPSAPPSSPCPFLARSTSENALPAQASLENSYLNVYSLTNLNWKSLWALSHLEPYFMSGRHTVLSPFLILSPPGWKPVGWGLCSHCCSHRSGRQAGTPSHSECAPPAWLVQGHPLPEVWLPPAGSLGERGGTTFLLTRSYTST